MRELVLRRLVSDLLSTACASRPEGRVCGGEGEEGGQGRLRAGAVPAPHALTGESV